VDDAGHRDLAALGRLSSVVTLQRLNAFSAARDDAQPAIVGAQ
jgi:hypothetical protein